MSRGNGSLIYQTCMQEFLDGLDEECTELLRKGDITRLSCMGDGVLTRLVDELAACSTTNDVLDALQEGRLIHTTDDRPGIRRVLKRRTN